MRAHVVVLVLLLSGTIAIIAAERQSIDTTRFATMKPITQPITATPVSLPIATRTPTLFPRVPRTAEPVKWDWRKPDARACEGALYFTRYCAGPTHVPYVGGGGY